MKERKKRNNGIFFLAAILLSSLLFAGDRQVLAADRKEPVREEENSRAEQIPGEILVMYREGTGEEEIQQITKEQGGDHAEILYQAGGEAVVRAELPRGLSVEEAVAGYQSQPDVLAVSPNYEIELFSDYAVNDSGYFRQDYLYQTQMQGAWEILQEVPHQKIKVAVLDTGIDIGHPDLINVLDLEKSCEILDGSGKTGPLKGDGYANGEFVSYTASHGTHVNGLLAAEAGNAQGIAGAASAGDNSVVDLIVIDVFYKETTTSLAYLIQGMEYAREAGAKVINLSLGVKKEALDDSLLNAVCDNMAQEGMILVCAAGNYGLSDDGEISVVPADYDSTVSVIAVDEKNVRMSRSAYGIRKDICAPGKDLYSTKMNGTYGTMSGTSMATPLVTAAAAMMCSVKPELTVTEMKDLLRKTATDLGGSGFESETAAGLLNARRAVERAAAGKLPQTELPYEDVQEEAWYTAYVSYMYRNRIMTGLSKTKFGPFDPLCRAQFAVILYRCAGSPDIDAPGSFPDIAEGQFYTEAVAWAKKEGVAQGYENGSFGPGDVLTREQAAVFLYRYVKGRGYAAPLKKDLEDYPDGWQVSPFADEAMRWAVAQGIIQGDGGHLKPQKTADRAECAAIIRRFMEQY